jgi:hypothetical protein
MKGNKEFLNNLRKAVDESKVYRKYMTENEVELTLGYLQILSDVEEGLDGLELITFCSENQIYTHKDLDRILKYNK